MKAWKLFILFVGIGVLAGATVTSFQSFTAQTSTAVTPCRGNECVRKGGNSWCRQKGQVCEQTATRPCFVCVDDVGSSSSSVTP